MGRWDSQKSACSRIWNQKPGDKGWEADTNGNRIADGIDRDLDRNGKIGLGDLTILARAWNRTCP